jgi:hypothetical protein
MEYDKRILGAVIGREFALNMAAQYGLETARLYPILMARSFRTNYMEIKSSW